MISDIMFTLRRWKNSLEWNMVLILRGTRTMSTTWRSLQSSTKIGKFLLKITPYLTTALCKALTVNTLRLSSQSPVIMSIKVRLTKWDPRLKTLQRWSNLKILFSSFKETTTIASYKKILILLKSLRKTQFLSLIIQLTCQLRLRNSTTREFSKWRREIRWTLTTSNRWPIKTWRKVEFQRENLIW